MPLDLIKYQKEYREKNREKINAYKRKHRKDYPEKRKEYIKRIRLEKPTEYYAKIKVFREKYKNNPKTCYVIYKNSAKQRKHKFSLSFEEFMTFWQKPCSYCGDKIKTIGLDRVDSKKGYTLDNIKSCCWVCNKMKLNYTEEEFYNHCKKIITFRYQNSIRA